MYKIKQPESEDSLHQKEPAFASENSLLSDNSLHLKEPIFKKPISGYRRA